MRVYLAGPDVFGVFRFVGGRHSGEGRDIERVPLPGLISSERTPLPMNVSESLQ